MENRLESLGVNAIDPDDPNDMAVLEDIMLGNNRASAQSISSPPDLEDFAELYTIHQYDGSVTVGGTLYQYAYIYVTDDKGYSRSPLTSMQNSNILIGKESTLLKDLLDYQFSFGLSSYLGSIPYGWALDWTLGTVSTVFNSFNESSIVSYTGNGSIYSMSMLSVTQMMYVYVYLPSAGDWCLCGTRAPNVSYVRAEHIVANVAGTPVSDAKNYPTVSSSTGSAPYTYVQSYVYGFYHDIDYIGSYTVNTYNGSAISFTPGFASYPIHLL